MIPPTDSSTLKQILLSRAKEHSKSSLLYLGTKGNDIFNMACVREKIKGLDCRDTITGLHEILQIPRLCGRIIVQVLFSVETRRWISWFP